MMGIRFREGLKLRSRAVVRAAGMARARAKVCARAGLYVSAPGLTCASSTASTKLSTKKEPKSTRAR